MKNEYVIAEYLKGRNRLEEAGIDGRIIQSLALKKQR
jgi:hypothetical protein